MINNKTVAVVIPCFKVKQKIGSVISTLPVFIDTIIAVDDCCPEGSGEFIRENFSDPRLIILKNSVNLGVGGAVITGYRHALQIKMDIVVKMDGDGQMDPALLPELILPIAQGKCDYTKGNRFYWLDGLKEMPPIRLFGNSVLSFVNKVASGYWDVMDPTNGYTAISSKALSHIQLEKLEKRYFFESDLLFRLGLNKANVMDIPMEAKYDGEISNLNITNTAMTFPLKYLSRTFKRIFYQYFLRDFNAGSVSLLLSIPFFSYGSIYGIYKWSESIELHRSTPTGTLFLIALAQIFGMQLLISFIHFDVQNQRH